MCGGGGSATGPQRERKLKQTEEERLGNNVTRGRKGPGMGEDGSEPDVYSEGGLSISQKRNKRNNRKPQRWLVEEQRKQQALADARQAVRTEWDNNLRRQQVGQAAYESQFQQQSQYLLGAPVDETQDPTKRKKNTLLGV